MFWEQPSCRPELKRWIKSWKVQTGTQNFDSFRRVVRQNAEHQRWRWRWSSADKVHHVSKLRLRKVRNVVVDSELRVLVDQNDSTNDLNLIHEAETVLRDPALGRIQTGLVWSGAKQRTGGLSWCEHLRRSTGTSAVSPLSLLSKQNQLLWSLPGNDLLNYLIGRFTCCQHQLLMQ